MSSEEIKIYSTINAHDARPLALHAEVLPVRGWLHARLTPDQQTEIEKHFCGQRGCYCGSADLRNLRAFWRERMVFIIGSREDRLPTCAYCGHVFDDGEPIWVNDDLELVCDKCLSKYAICPWFMANAKK